MAKTVLITGASGFTGGHVYTRARDVDCFGTYFTYAGKRYQNWHHVDLADFDQVQNLIEAVNPEAVIHTAADSNLDACEKHPHRAFRYNVQATTHLVKACQGRSLRFIYLSTDMVFDGQGSLYKETDVCHPISVYGRTKLQAEGPVLELQNAVVVRSALIYGRPAISGTSFSVWLEDRLQKHQRVPLYHDQFRSPICVNNLADLLLELVDSEFTGILHLGGADRIDRYTFGQKVCEICNYDASLLDSVPMDSVTPVAPRPRDVSLDIRWAREVLRGEILGIEEGLALMKRRGEGG